MALSCSADGNMVGFSVLNKEEAVLGKVSLPSDVSVLVCFSCSVEMVVAFSEGEDEDSEVDDIGIASDSFSGSSVLNMEDDVTVTVSCVDTSDVWSLELSSTVDNSAVLFSGLREYVSD